MYKNTYTKRSRPPRKREGVAEIRSEAVSIDYSANWNSSDTEATNHR